MKKSRPNLGARTGTLVAALAAALLLPACAPLVLGGAAVGGVLVYKDRRSSGTQLDDQTIELKSLGALTPGVGDRGHINVTAYNRVVLLSGEVPTAADRQAAQQAMEKLELVRSVVNELNVGPASSLSERASDALVTTKVKATLIDDAKVEGHAVKVVTERGTVYLMGRLTPAELDKATQLTRTISGVKRVVRVAETISEEELAALRASQAAAPAEDRRPAP